MTTLIIVGDTKAGRQTINYALAEIAKRHVRGLADAAQGIVIDTTGMHISSDSPLADQFGEYYRRTCVQRKDLGGVDSANAFFAEKYQPIAVPQGNSLSFPLKRQADE